MLNNNCITDCEFTDRWYEAVFKRHSRRKYLQNDVPQEKIDSLRTCLDSINKISESVQVVLLDDNPDQVFRGFVGSYGKIAGAPLYACFVGDKSDPYMYEKLGYIGEGLILEATSLGLDTCWAGIFDSGQANALVNEQLNAPEKDGNHKNSKIDSFEVIAVSPVGYGVLNLRLEEKLMSTIVKGKKRKDVTELLSDGFDDTWPEWIKTALISARAAPSAVNRQPWRFHICDDHKSILVYTDDKKPLTGIPKRLDCGISMLHLEVGASACGQTGEWEILEHPNVARFTVDE